MVGMLCMDGPAYDIKQNEVIVMTEQTMPVMALRGLTVFPNMLLHFDVGREASIRALDEAMASGRYL